MKSFTKFLKFTFLAMIALVAFTPILVHAQDSTAVSAGAGLAETIISSLSLKFPVITTVGTVLFLLSEALSFIPSVKANGVFQAITNGLKAIFSSKAP